MSVKKVISGGQTGVDRAGLDAAMAAGIPVGGYCPKGRRAEDGKIPDRYPMIELASENYRDRTEKNIIESDATLILTVGVISGGTTVTLQLAERHGKPYMIEALDGDPVPNRVVHWLKKHHVSVLNIAGPRESQNPGYVHAKAAEFLRRVFGA
jgi:predicted Rossmann-fold nucleotide-binding protein